MSETKGDGFQFFDGYPQPQPRRTSLRDALAAALAECADAILSDPAFRAALTEAVAEALATRDFTLLHRCPDCDRAEAAAIVARMLEERA